MKILSLPRLAQQPEKEEMEIQDLALVSVTTLGFLTLSRNLVRFLRWVWAMFLRPPRDLKDRYGSWAIVTGSTDGIGKALAFELASKGLNLVLIGRDPSKLEATSREITSRNYGTTPVQIKTRVIDLAKASGEEMANGLEDIIRELDIGILINNAGVAYPYARYFHEVGLELMDSIIKVNIEAPTWLTKCVIGEMLKKKKGAIVNIGSASSLLPSYPLYAIYASSKAYLDMFSRCTHLEYKQHGIDIQCQIPLLVATKMARLKKSSFFVPSPEAYAKASIRWIGHEDVLCAPFWSHSVQWSILGLLPGSVVEWAIFTYFLGMRKRGMKKDVIEKTH